MSEQLERSVRLTMAEYDRQAEAEPDPIMRALMVRDRGKVEATVRERIAERLDAEMHRPAGERVH